MGILTDSLLINLLGIAVAIVASIIAYYKWTFTYWSRKGLSFFPGTIPFGSVSGALLRRRSIGEEFLDIYKKIKANGWKHAGVYFGAQPFYIPVDVNIIKRMLQTDFGHWANHGGYVNEVNDPLNAHLFNLKDAKWRNMRVKLTPTFTSGKMKMMFNTLVECADGLKKKMDEFAIGKETVDIKDLLCRFTTDIIGSCAFGLQCNSLENPDSEFRKYGKKHFDITTWDHLNMFAAFFLPHWLLDIIGVKLIKNDVEKFFMNVVQETVDYREKNNISRNDFMQLLLQLKNKGFVSEDQKDRKEKTEQTLTLNEIAAEAFVFFAAGFETSSTTMTFALYELARNPDVQDELRKEVREMLIRDDNQITYDNVSQLSYLEKVIEETLRKYPPVPMLPRECTKDYTIPDTNIVLEKGTLASIPVIGIHHDPEYYPEPEKFEPERFSEENKRTRPPLTWLPFGEGPRNCIGLRFGLMQSKIGLITLISNYKLTLNEEKTKLPLKLDPKSFILAVEGGVWLNVEIIN